MKLTLRMIALQYLSKKRLWSFVTTGLEMACFAFRIFLLRPAMGIALLIMALLLIAQYIQPKGEGARYTLEQGIIAEIHDLQTLPIGTVSLCRGREAEPIGKSEYSQQPVMLPCEREAVPVELAVKAMVDSLIAWWWTLVFLSVVFDVICRYFGFTGSKTQAHTGRPWWQRLMKRAGGHDE